MKETDEFLKEYEKTKESLKSLRLYLVDEHARHRAASSSSSSSNGSSWRRSYDEQTDVEPKDGDIYHDMGHSCVYVEDEHRWIQLW